MSYIREANKREIRKKTFVSYANQVYEKKDGSLGLNTTLGRVLKVLVSGVYIHDNYTEEELFVPYERIFSWLDKKGGTSINSLFEEEKISKDLINEKRVGKSDFKEKSDWIGTVGLHRVLYEPSFKKKENKILWIELRKDKTDYFWKYTAPVPRWNKGEIDISLFGFLLTIGWRS